MNKFCLVTLFSTLVVSVQVSAQPIEPLNTLGGSKVSRQCLPLDSAHLKAQYQVTNAKGQNWSMTLLRDGQDFIIQRDATSFELWSANGEYVRYFPKEKRSVTYRRGDLLALNIQHDREQLYHLVSPTLTKRMHKTLLKHDGCFDAQGYAGKVNGVESELNWIEGIALPKQFTLGEVTNFQLQYKLVSVEPFDAKAFAALTQHYQDIDFADVGDSESDPFIAKMINQGFIEHGSSGFYSSEGHAIGSQNDHGSHVH
ncbi:hypothetical protein [Shewanella acanthi]|uniref:hypothetical protein n=1 Tax=Shewanella acanthi TaxID=2864212 RepID=UPI001C65A7AD|nr:hypothetical protein [Shewanella acanthi]QYJ78388.1 hypothetical protein K0H61_14990 [Shewanella acanthi]